MSFLLTLPCFLFSMFTTACRFAICMIPPRRLFFNRKKHQYYLPLSIECHHLHRTLSYNQCYVSSISLYTDFVLHNVPTDQVVVINGGYSNSYQITIQSIQDRIVYSIHSWNDIDIIHNRWIQETWLNCWK